MVDGASPMSVGFVVLLSKGESIDFYTIYLYSCNL